MRDPFVNYDSWLEQPYQEQYERDEWFLENETAECANCGYDHGKRCELDTEPLKDEDGVVITHGPKNTDTYDGAFCPECNAITEVKVVEPEMPDDDYDYEPPERDEGY